MLFVLLSGYESLCPITTDSTLLIVFITARFKGEFSRVPAFIPSWPDLERVCCCSGMICQKKTFLDAKRKKCNLKTALHALTEERMVFQKLFDVRRVVHSKWKSSFEALDCSPQVILTPSLNQSHCCNDTCTWSSASSSFLQKSNSLFQTALKKASYQNNVEEYTRHSQDQKLKFLRRLSFPLYKYTSLLDSRSANL